MELQEEKKLFQRFGVPYYGHGEKQILIALMAALARIEDRLDQMEKNMPLRIANEGVDRLHDFMSDFEAQLP